ncbi:MAG: hypothetical protein IJL32_03510 [Oscillospiraceae bacterium]|nr:hypothetical protein [Oscillospiraceae bacterium]
MKLIDIMRVKGIESPDISEFPQNRNVASGTEKIDEQNDTCIEKGETMPDSRNKP